MDLVTVIIPCYNSGKTLQRAVDSVVNQTFENIELIIINDGSNDTKQLKVLKTLKHAKIINQKIMVWLQLGMKALKSQKVIISFLDADDWLNKNTISFMLKTIKNILKICSLFFIIRRR